MTIENKKNRDNYPIRRVFIIDEISIALSMAMALLLRHGIGVTEGKYAYINLFMTIVVTLCLFHVIIYLVYDNRKPSIFIQDPVENLLTVMKSRLLLTFLSLIYLYIIQRSSDFSRIIMALFVVISITLGYTFRMVYRNYHIKKYGVIGKARTLTISYPFPGKEELGEKVRDGKYDDILLITGNADEEEIDKTIGFAEELGIRTYCSINALGYEVKSGIVTDVSDHASIPAFVRREKFKLFGIEYSIARTEEAVLHVMRHIEDLSGKYICFSNVHTSVMARENTEYVNILNGSAFTFPDGAPISKLQRRNGIIGADRVAGPDFMEHMFRNTMDGKITHFFYGSKQETLDALKANLEAKYPGVVIKGLYSPPFREMTKEEDKADVDMINASNADIIWIGLGAPKQEKWMRAHKGKINGVMMGVGAGFDFHAGTIKRAPAWIQKVGLEWLYRLFQDPERLFKRYFVTNIKFMLYFIAEIFRKGV